ncbi:glutamate receptor ionotropic, kainate 2-like [Ornithodoros turicata]|uniref:glutamate receptor ionotropic, kainate 2-like n=1 Tax=Ornithodoros turicata TaxID=34597 RepID=UPI0031392FA3
MVQPKWNCVNNVCVWIVALACFGLHAVALPDTIYVGAIVEGDEDREQELAFRYAIDRINKNNAILPSSRLQLLTERLSSDDLFHASKTVCHLVEKGVRAMFGFQSPGFSGLIEGACGSFNIPFLRTRWSGIEESPLRPRSYTLTFYPHPEDISKAYLDLAQLLEWQSFTIIYSSDTRFVYHKDVLKYSLHPPAKANLILCCEQENSLENVFKLLRGKREQRIILNLPHEDLSAFFSKAAEESMATEHHEYIVTTLDVHTLNTTAWRGLAAAVYGLRILDPQQPEVRIAIRDWNFGELLFGKRVDRTTIKTETALIYDAVALLARSLHDLDGSQTIYAMNLSCSKPGMPNVWPHGHSLVNYMKMVQLKGLTRNIRLDENGDRRNFLLDVLQFHDGEFIKAGSWTSSQGLIIGNKSDDWSSPRPHFRRRRLVRVTTIVNLPYVTLEKQIRLNNSSSSHQFGGFTMELLDILAQSIGFDYQVHVPKDNQYGSMTKQGTWTGMVREVYEREADLAVGDLSVTLERMEYVEFTAPFLKNSQGLLYKNVLCESENLPYFLQPLSVEVWFYSLTAVLGVSLLLSLLARLSCEEWVLPSSRCPRWDAAGGDGSKRIRNRFTLLNSFWFVLASLMQQGTDVLPRAIATRVVAVVWWLFAIVLLSSYTASMASLLVAEKLQLPAIQSFQDLAKQSRITCGCVIDGPARSLLKGSADPHLRKLWSMIEMASPSVFARSLHEGIERVKKEPHYALIMDTQTIDYLVRRDCCLKQLQGTLESGGFAFATHKGSPLARAITSEILKLEQRGTLRLLRERWWNPSGKSSPGSISFPDGSTADARTSRESSPLSASQLRPLLLLLMTGCVLSFIVLLVECLWEGRCSTRKEQGKIWKHVRRGIRTSESVQDSTLIVLEPPKEFRDADEAAMTSCTNYSAECTFSGAR